MHGTTCLHEIFKYADLKFTVYSRKHTYTQLPPMQSDWFGARSGSPQLVESPSETNETDLSPSIQ